MMGSLKAWNSYFEWLILSLATIKLAALPPPPPALKLVPKIICWTKWWKVFPVKCYMASFRHWFLQLIHLKLLLLWSILTPVTWLWYILSCKTALQLPLHVFLLAGLSLSSLVSISLVMGVGKHHHKVAFFLNFFSYQVVAIAFAIMAMRSLDLNWTMKIVRSLPAILLPVLSFVVYTMVVRFTRMCKYLEL